MGVEERFVKGGKKDKRNQRACCTICGRFVKKPNALCSYCAADPGTLTVEDSDQAAGAVPEESKPCYNLRQNEAEEKTETTDDDHDEDLDSSSELPNPTTEDENLECFNCRRSGQTLQAIATANISTKRKFCLFSVRDIKNKQTILLCTECTQVTEKGSVYNDITRPGWPAFIWSILRDRKCQAAHGDELWRLIPETWRPWWFKATTSCWSNTNISLKEPNPFFKDATSEKAALDGAIREMKWVELVKQVDKHGFIPFVRCPWGCAEFYNEAKSIELDVVFKAFLKDREKQLWMSDKKRFKFMNGARKDYMESAHAILHNPNWMCSPSIFVPTGKAPVVLTCRYHEKGSTLQYLHVPTNPTGTIMCEGVDQCASTVLVPKTVHVAKAKAYTNSFQMNRLDGTFEGVDSVVLTDHGRFDRSNQLADKRDALSIAGRADVSAHIEELVKQEIMPAWLAKDKLQYANELFPQHEMPDVFAKHCKGATFVTLEDAIDMELWLKSQTGSEVVTSYPKLDGTTVERTINYVETWPRILIRVHPVDKFGAKFPPLPKYHNSPLNCRTLWVLTAMVSYVGQLWKVVVRNVKRTSDWYGWVLTYAARECLAGSYLKGSNNNPFRKVLKHAKLAQKLFSMYNNGQYSPKVIGTLFADLNDSVYLVRSSDLTLTAWEAVSQEIVICYQDTNESSQDDPVPEMIGCANAGKTWELRFLLKTSIHASKSSWSATVYSRHGTHDFPGWWKHNLGDIETRHHSDSNLSPNERSTWDVCIFVTTKRQDMNALKEKYLQSCGGQTAVRCHEHNAVPLVVGPAKMTYSCFYCDANSYYICPTPNCSIGICKKHHAEVTTKNPDGPFVLKRRSTQQNSSHTRNVSHDQNCDEPNKASSFSEECLQNPVSKHKAAVGDPSPHEDFVNNADDMYEAFDTLDIPEECDEPCDEGVYPIGYQLDDVPIAAQHEHVEQDLLDASLVNEIHADVDSKLSQASSSSVLSSNSSATAANTNNDDEKNQLPQKDENESRHILDGNDWVTCNINPTDLLDWESENGETDNCGELWFPTTNAGREAYTLEANNTRHAIGLSVLLNKHATLLVRRKQKLEASRKEKSFLQAIVATTTRGTIPLVYPEGMLFPSIFSFACSDGSLVGAIPVGCLNAPTILKRHGIASLQDHGRTRMMDPSILCSSDHRYQFYAMDVCANFGMRGQDTRLILSRGFAHLQGAGGVRASRRDQSAGDQLMFDTDSVDSRSNVNKLAAALNKHKGSLFYTHTCSMKTHFGIRKIKEWLDDDSAVHSVMEDLYGKSCTFPVTLLEETRQQLIQSSCVLAMRCWINIINIYMAYITKSPEKPIGHVLRSWYRLELQEAEANVPHVHAILWLAEDDGTMEGRNKILHNIRASIRGMVTEEECEGYLSKGILSSQEELKSILDGLGRMLRHKHGRRCMIPTRSGTSNPPGLSVVDGGYNNDLPSVLHNSGYRCKVPDNRLLSENPNEHCFIEINVKHTDAARNVLVQIGLAEELPHGSLKYTDESLITQRHVPPTSPGEGIISPVLVPLIIMNPNSDNVQYLDSACVARYLAKYVASVDECNRVYLSPPNEKHKSFTIQVEGTGNTKITSVAMAEKDKKNSNRRLNHHGRMVSQPENIMLQLQIPQIYTDITFRHIPTVPLEERAAFDREAPIDKLREHGIVCGPISSVSDLSSSLIPSHVGRRRFPKWRQFKESALTIAKDQIMSPLTIDGTTIFGLRPPELYFIKRQDIYLQCFETFPVDVEIKEKENLLDAQIRYCRTTLSPDYQKCLWIDARNRRVKLRLAGVPTILEYINESPPAHFGGAGNKSIVHSLFELLRNTSHEIEHASRRTRSFAAEAEALKARFLCCNDEIFLPVVWFTNIKPVHQSRFLIHILLSMGEFDNEIDLWSTGSIRSAFIHANLFDPECPLESIHGLTRRYVLEQLRSLPGGTPQFDRFLVAAHSVFMAALYHDQVAADGLPPYLYTHLRHGTDERIQHFLNQTFNTLADVVLRQLSSVGLPDLPTVQELAEARNTCSSGDSEFVRWNALNVPKSPSQPEESHAEQLEALRIGNDVLKQYIDVNNPYSPKSLCIIGDPGSGKTTVLSMLALHAMSLGLNVGMTAMMSERALQLGGRHLHIMFGLPVRDGCNPSRMAELAYSNLLKRPVKMQYLRSLDVLAIDELGQISAELLAMLDIVLRRVRNCTRFMGGVLLMCTMDVMQLLPIRGRPPMTSPHMITSFKFARLKHSVRAAGDVAFQRIQKITRLLPTEFTDEIANEFASLVRANCTFVDSFDDERIPKSALLVFSKKQARNEAIKKKLALIKESEGYSMSKACDQVRTLEGDWQTALESHSQRLNRECKEPSELYFFRGATYEITFNKENCFSHTQLAKLMDEPPSQEHLKRFLPIRVLVAPPGNKVLPPDDTTAQQLIEQGWTIQKVGIAPDERISSCGPGLKGRRKQYGLRPRIATTIHSVMGQDVPAIVTKVDMDDPLYTLWERAQAVVLLSRTPKASGTIFVGNPENTIRTLVETLRRITQFTRYICHLVNALTNQQDAYVTPEPIEIDLAYHPFRPIDVPLPMDDSGCVYLLVSCKDCRSYYIGQTSFLPDRINYHNSGYGSKQTDSIALRPWAILAYVVGFDWNKISRISFETEWELAREYETGRVRRKLLPDEVANLALKVISDRSAKSSGEDLRFVRCGTVASQPPPTIDMSFAASNNTSNPTKRGTSPLGPTVTNYATLVVPSEQTTTATNINGQQRPALKTVKVGDIPRQNPVVVQRNERDQLPPATPRTPYLCDTQQTTRPIDTGSFQHDAPRQGATATTIPIEGLLHDVARWRRFSFESHALNCMRPQQWLLTQVMDLFSILECQEHANVAYIPAATYSLYVDSITEGRSNPNVIDPNHCDSLLGRNIWIAVLNKGAFHWQLLAIINPGTTHCMGLVMDSLVDRGEKMNDMEKVHVRPSNFAMVGLFADACIRQIFHGVDISATTPKMHVALVPYQRNSYDCGPLTLLNIKYLLRHQDEIVNMQTRDNEPVDFSDWYDSQVHGANYRRTIFEKYQSLLSRPTANAHPSRPNRKHLNQKSEQAAKPQTTIVHNHDTKGATKTHIDLSRLIDDVHSWGPIIPMDTSGLDNLRQNVWLESHLMDLFGIVACQCSTTVQYLRSEIYTLFHLMHAKEHGDSRNVVQNNGEDLPRQMQQKPLWVSPINLGNWHWQLLLLVNPGSRNGVAILMDSNNCYPWRDPVNVNDVQTYANSLVREIFGQHAPLPSMQPSRVPPQPNSYDCGPFVLMNIAKILGEAEFIVDSNLKRRHDNIFHRERWYDAATEGVRYRQQLHSTYSEWLDRYGCLL